MKTYFKLLIVLALFIGLVGVSEARDRKGDGWTVTVMTGTSLTVNEGRCYLYGIFNSSGCSDKKQPALRILDKT